jgi:hypothetical protein
VNFVSSLFAYFDNQLNYGRSETLIVERIGFSTAFDDMVLSVMAKMNELV